MVEYAESETLRSSRELREDALDFDSALAAISAGRDWQATTLIDRGWSSDRKYLVMTRSGRRFLLRISAGDQLERKRFEYRCLQRISELGIEMSAPVEMGTCCDGSFVFTLLAWISGVEAEAELPHLSRAVQYELGTMAGAALRQIHTLTGDLGGQSWDAHYTAKVDRALANYEACPVKLPYGEEVMRFVRAALPRLRGRPITLQHGDFHVGNLIVTPERRIAVIDFNRCSCGDPWAEYDRYVFTWRASKDFATGQVDGYFAGHIPDEFFPLVSLYNGVNMLGSITWALPFGDAEVQVMLDNAAAVYSSYDGFRSREPQWYCHNR